MKKILVTFVAVAVLIANLFVFSPSADAVSRVRGYTKRNGTYVIPHFRSNKNYSKFDNWSTKGNTNPYTGKKGTKNIYKYR